MKQEHITACRQYARQIWREQRDLLPEEIINRIEIKEVACAGMEYSKQELLRAICPLLTPDEELSRLSKLDMWYLRDAVAVWRDVNPFIVEQIKCASKTDFWIQAFHPSLRSGFYILDEQAVAAVHDETLQSVITRNGEILVAPQVFYHWAVSVTDGPNGDRPQKFFHELSKSWSDEIDVLVGVPNPDQPRTGVRNAELQKDAKLVASRLKQSGRKDISKREVAKLLAASQDWRDMNATTIERIIRVEW